MKSIILAFACLLSFSAFSQKIKYKKNTVKIDGTEMYKFEKLKKTEGGLQSGVQVSDIEGNALLVFKDYVFYYDQLYYEKGPRKGEVASKIEIISSGQEYIVPFFAGGFNTRKTIHRLLEMTDFYKRGEFDEEVMSKILEKLDYKKGKELLASFDQMNIFRFKNAELTKQNYGEVPTRKPANFSAVLGGKLRDKVNVGKIVLDKKGKLGNVYLIKNNNDIDIATMFIHHYPSKKGNLRTFVNDTHKEFNFEVEKSFSTPDASVEMKKRQEEMFRYLLVAGYM